MNINENKNLPKDVFLHLLSIIALYISAGSLITLIFQYINLYFPDALRPIYYSGTADTIRWTMASLVIVFPVYLAVIWMLDRDYLRFPEKRELKIRKWLVYFTLFLGGIILITDLVTLVYNFLGGDLTLPFLLKVLAFFIVIGTIFAYYLLDLRQQLNSRAKYWFVLASSSAVLFCIIGGFFTAGSPFKARLYKFDEQRINDLQTLQYQIIDSYWVQKEVLPPSLDDLKNDITGFVPPKDPETNQPYSYSIDGALTFRLCANFNLGSDSNINAPKPVYYEPQQQNWNHGEGNVCFSRTIDPQLYRDRLKPMRL